MEIQDLFQLSNAFFARTKLAQQQQAVFVGQSAQHRRRLSGSGAHLIKIERGAAHIQKKLQ